MCSQYSSCTLICFLQHIVLLNDHVVMVFDCMLVRHWPVESVKHLPSIISSFITFTIKDSLSTWEKVEQQLDLQFLFTSVLKINKCKITYDVSMLIWGLSSGSSKWLIQVDHPSGSSKWIIQVDHPSGLYK